MTNRIAPYTHALDGSNCWTKNCSRGHVNGVNEAVTAQDFDAYVEAREQQAKTYNLASFHKKFAKWAAKHAADNTMPEVLVNKTVLPKILAKTIPPLLYTKDGQNQIFTFAGDYNTDYDNADTSVIIKGRTLEQAAANVIKPDYVPVEENFGTENKTNHRKLKAYFGQEGSIEDLKKREKAITKVWNNKAYDDLRLDASAVSKIHAYGVQTDRDYPHLEDPDKAVILAETMGKRESFWAYKYAVGSDNEEWQSHVVDTWSIYKQMEKNLL